ncbi:MAG: hypothetical protein ACE5GX_17120 [Thermoanaerobaculia bacterium]
MTALPRLLLLSLPKAGTHLLSKAAAMLPGMQGSGLHVDFSYMARFVDDPDTVDPRQTGEWSIEVQPGSVHYYGLRKMLQAVCPGEYITSHLRYSRELVELSNELGYRTVYIVRDPRDLAVSLAFYIPSQPGHELFEFFSSLSPEERITRAIVGSPKAENGVKRLRSLAHRLSKHAGWLHEPGVLTVRFEDLVGSRGGGSAERQSRTLSELCRQIGLKPEPVVIDRIGHELFGGTHTFRKGTIGDWKNHFSEYHLRLLEGDANHRIVEFGYPVRKALGGEPIPS